MRHALGSVFYSIVHRISGEHPAKLYVVGKERQTKQHVPGPQRDQCNGDTDPQTRKHKDKPAIATSPSVSLGSRHRASMSADPPEILRGAFAYVQFSCFSA